MPGARNPKTASFTVNVSTQINERLERLADAAGMNKSAMGALCLAIGLNIQERAFLIAPSDYGNKAVEEMAEQMAADVQEVVDLKK